MAESNTVTVACKLPHGLDLEEYGVVLNGSNHPSALQAGGFGITEDVPRDAMVAWRDTHKTYTPVAKGLIFFDSKTDAVAAQARERSAVRSGFEVLDPAKMPDGLEAVPAPKT